MSQDQLERKTLKDKIALMLRSKTLDAALLEHLPVQELVEEIGVYHQELIFQNEELIRTAASLENARSLYQALFDDAPIGYLILDTEQRIRSANRALYALLGDLPGSLIAQPLARFIHPESQDTFYLAMRRMEQSGSARIDALELLSAGRTITVNFSGNRMDQDGETLLRCTLVDISEQAAAEKGLREREAQNLRLLEQLTAAQQDLTALNASLEQRVIQALEDQQESETTFQTLFEAATDAICLFDSQMVIQRVNPACARLLGCASPEAMIGRSLVDFMVDDHALGAIERYNRLLTGERMPPSERQLRGEDGRLVDVEATASLMPNRPGRQGYVLSILRDISERKQAQSALRLAQQRLELAIHSADIGLWDWDRATDRVYFTAEFTRMLGYEKDEFGSHFRDWSSNLHPDDLDRAQAALNAYLAEPEAQYRSEFRLRHKDGSYRWFLETGALVQERPDEPGHLLGSQIDITERKLAELALFQSRQQYLTVMDSLDSAIVHADWDGRYLYINQVGAALLGKPPEEILGKTFSDLLPPDEAALNYANVRRAISTKQGSVSEEQLSFLDGSTHWFRGSVQPVFNLQGEAVQAVIAATDITRIKQAQVQLETLAGQLQTANQALARALSAKDEFLSAMSHELRTPLTAILGLAEALRYGISGSLSEKQLQSVQQIESSGQRLYQMIQQVLEYTYLQSSDYPLHRAPVVLVQVADAALKGVAAAAGKKRQRLSLSTAQADLQINADEQLVLQMLTHLLDNAIKFTPAGGQIQLSIDSRPETGEARLSVADTGIGIEAEQMQRIFQPFVQVDARLARHYEGAGLGLPLVKALAGLHGGRVEAESTPGQGSCF
ncbi:MAG: PAS domain S-box protein, partial [Chloroflexota bacterium]